MTETRPHDVNRFAGRGNYGLFMEWVFAAFGLAAAFG